MVNVSNTSLKNPVLGMKKVWNPYNASSLQTGTKNKFEH